MIKELHTCIAIPLVCGLFLVLPFSPFACFLASVLILSFSKNWINGANRKIIGLILIVSGSLVISSREVTWLIPSDDMLRYFWVFEQINLAKADIFQFYGIEFILPLFYKLYGYINSSASVNEVMFVTSLTISLFFWSWLEFYGNKFVKAEQKSLLIASSIFFFSFYFCTQLPRQMLGVTFVLFALSTKGKKQFLYLSLGFFSHLTTLPIYLLGKCLLHKPKLTLFITVLFALTFKIAFPVFIDLIKGSDLTSSMFFNKIKYYQGSNVGFTAPDLAWIPYLFLIFGGFFIFQNPEKLFKGWGAFFLGNFIVYLFLLPFPLLPLRVSLLIVGIMLGFFMVQSLQKIPSLLVLFITVLSVKRFYELGIVESEANYLWKKFPIYSFEPFYYFSMLN